MLNIKTSKLIYNILESKTRYLYVDMMHGNIFYSHMQMNYLLGYNCKLCKFFKDYDE
jgi:hypothetical protein